MQTTITIRGNAKDYSFTALIHEVASPEGLRLGPDFYRTFGKIPEGLHHEVELVDPGLDFCKQYGLHMHRDTEGKPFMCFPYSLPTPEKTLFIYKVWCVGAVLRVETGIQMNTEITEKCRGDLGEFLLRANEVHGISVLE